MGCKISKLPADTESTLEKQKAALDSLYTNFQPMEEEIKSGLLKKNENMRKLQEILAWKNESEKKISKLESLLKSLQAENENNSEELVDINSIEIQIEDQHAELIKILTELKTLS